MGTPAPDAVKRLVDRFDQNRKVFLSPGCNEEQLRAELDQRLAIFDASAPRSAGTWAISLTRFRSEIG